MSNTIKTAAELWNKYRSKNKIDGKFRMDVDSFHNAIDEIQTQLPAQKEEPKEGDWFKMSKEDWEAAWESCDQYRMEYLDEIQQMAAEIADLKSQIATLKAETFNREQMIGFAEWVDAYYEWVTNGLFVHYTEKNYAPSAQKRLTTTDLLNEFLKQKQ